MASPNPPHVTAHWVRIEDADLAYILDGPDEDVEDFEAELRAYVDEVLDIIEDGLETA